MSMDCNYDFEVKKEIKIPSAIAYAVVFDNIILRFTLGNSEMEAKIKYVATGSHSSWNDALRDGYRVKKVIIKVFDD